MPAITVDDVLVLHRLPKLDPAVTRFRKVLRLTTAPRGYELEALTPARLDALAEISAAVVARIDDIEASSNRGAAS